jgi:hypothetical protein
MQRQALIYNEINLHQMPPKQYSYERMVISENHHHYKITSLPLNEKNQSNYYGWYRMCNQATHKYLFNYSYSVKPTAISKKAT